MLSDCTTVVHKTDGYNGFTKCGVIVVVTTTFVVRF